MICKKNGISCVIYHKFNCSVYSVAHSTSEIWIDRLRFTRETKAYPFLFSLLVEIFLGHTKWAVDIFARLKSLLRFICRSHPPQTYSILQYECWMSNCMHVSCVTSCDFCEMWKFDNDKRKIYLQKTDLHPLGRVDAEIMNSPEIFEMLKCDEKHNKQFINFCDGLWFVDDIDCVYSLNGFLLASARSCFDATRKIYSMEIRWALGNGIHQNDMRFHFGNFATVEWIESAATMATCSPIRAVPGVCAWCDVIFDMRWGLELPSIYECKMKWNGKWMIIKALFIRTMRTHTHTHIHRVWDGVWHIVLLSTMR